MRPGERISIIKRIAAKLAEMSGTDMGLTLRQFGVQTSDPDWDHDFYDFAVGQLEPAADGSLVDLADHLFPEDTAGRHFDSTAPGPWRAGAFRLFISHTNKHRKRAGALRETLGRWGVDAFVAHDAIEPTREWQDEIESALRTCDALCALLTPDFIESRWCDQEVGFAVARAIVVVPLKYGSDPHGFIGKYQALSIAEGTYASDVAHRILESLVRNAQTAKAIAPAVAERYAKSTSFESTRRAWPLLSEIPREAWTSEMMDLVAKAGEQNSQVKHANLPGPISIASEAERLLGDIRGPAPQAAGVSDDDIPF